MYRQLLTRRCDDGTFESLPSWSSASSLDFSRSCSTSTKRRNPAAFTSRGSCKRRLEGRSIFHRFIGTAREAATFSAKTRLFSGVALISAVAIFVFVLTEASAWRATRRSYSRLFFLKRKISAAEFDSNKAPASSSNSDGVAADSHTAVHAKINNSTPPVVIAMINHFYFGERFARVVPRCTLEGTGASLPCEFTADHARINDSSALA